MELFHFTEGRLPLLVNVPHAGTFVPSEIMGRFSSAGQRLADTDWHVDRLYDFARTMGASMLCATHSRYVIDLNRPTDGSVLYPGENNTELVPLTSFAHEDLYRPGQRPDAEERAARIARFWQPYHEKLAQTLDDLRAQFGVALLLDAHSIPSRVPRFFEGRLWDLNLGSADGQSADPALVSALATYFAGIEPYSSTVDGRFKGGHITRTYGEPSRHVHAVQMELVQETYMQEGPDWPFIEERAARIRPVLRGMLEIMLAWADAPEEGSTP
jgi:N-formylglutamate deformylase